MNIYLTRIPRKPIIGFVPNDLFVGIYWRYWHSCFMEYWYVDFFIVFVPTIVIAFRLERPSPFQTNDWRL